MRRWYLDFVFSFLNPSLAADSGTRGDIERVAAAILVRHRRIAGTESQALQRPHPGAFILVDQAVLPLIGGAAGARSGEPAPYGTQHRASGLAVRLPPARAESRFRLDHI